MAAFHPVQVSSPSAGLAALVFLPVAVEHLAERPPRRDASPRAVVATGQAPRWPEIRWNSTGQAWRPAEVNHQQRGTTPARGWMATTKTWMATSKLARAQWESVDAGAVWAVGRCTFGR